MKIFTNIIWDIPVSCTCGKMLFKVFECKYGWVEIGKDRHFFKELIILEWLGNFCSRES